MLYWRNRRLPAADTFSRDQVMFQAGRTAARARRRWLWPGATLAMTALAACLGLTLLVRPAPESVVEYVYVDRPVSAPPSAPELPMPAAVMSAEPVAMAPSSYRHLQEMFVRFGIDPSPGPAALAAAPGSGPSSAPTTSAWDWRPGSPLAASLFDSGVN